MTSLDPRWSVQPVPAGMAIIVGSIGLHQIYVATQVSWPLLGWVLAGFATCLTVVVMLTLGWARHDPDWTRRGYFLAATVAVARGLYLFHTGGAIVDVAIMGGLGVLSLCSWRAEVEARWVRNRPS